MAELRLKLDGGETLLIPLPDGQQVIEGEMRKCGCGCGLHFLVGEDPARVYLNDDHKNQHNNDQQPRKTPRRHK